MGVPNDLVGLGVKSKMSAQKKQDRLVKLTLDLLNKNKTKRLPKSYTNTLVTLDLPNKNKTEMHIDQPRLVIRSSF